MSRETVFPVLQARNLNGRRFILPAEFGGERNITIIAFQRQHQELVDSWFPLLDPLLARYADLRAYELPVIGSMYTLARSFIDGGMAAAIPDPAVRERTLTIYTDVRRVLASLQIASTATIVLLLVNRAGWISWRDEGPATRERAMRLERFLALPLER